MRLKVGRSSAVVFLLLGSLAVGCAPRRQAAPLPPEAALPQDITTLVEQELAKKDAVSPFEPSVLGRLVLLDEDEALELGIFFGKRLYQVLTSFQEFLVHETEEKKLRNLGVSSKEELSALIEMNLIKHAPDEEARRIVLWFRYLELVFPQQPNLAPKAEAPSLSADFSALPEIEGDATSVGVFQRSDYSIQQMIEAVQFVSKNLSSSLLDVLFLPQAEFEQALRALPYESFPIYLALWAGDVRYHILTMATRIKTLKPYRASYVAQKAYNFLSVQDIVQEFGPSMNHEWISDWANFDEQRKTRFIEMLSRVCDEVSDVREVSCDEIPRLRTDLSQLMAMVDLLMETKNVLLSSKFMIGGVNPIVLEANQNQSTRELVIPFVDPQNAALREMIQKVIEEDWSRSELKLKVLFTGDSENSLKVELQEGIIPHVMGFGSSTIYLDSSAGAESGGDLRKVFSHEFGHLLGFHDCYVEFYSEQTASTVRYVLNEHNLMCHEANGPRILRHHANELIEKYLYK